MNRFILILILIGLVACKRLNYSNQSSECIIIEDSDFDFGVIPDSVERLYHQFSIVNNTPDTCRITRIEKSCGCTDVKLGSSVIAPFSSSFIDVKIDIGTNYSFFERDIAVYTDFQNEPYVIFVRASRKMPVQVLRHEFPLKISDDLRINTPFLILGNISFGNSKSGFINILNTSDKTISFSAKIIDAPSFVSVFHESEIGANEVGRIVVSIDLTKIKDVWGLQKYTLLIESEKNELKIPIEAIFVEKFKKDVDTPRILIPISNYTIDTSRNSEIEFCIRNVGKNILYIRNIETNECINSVAINSYQIFPNSQDTLRVHVEKKQKENIEIGITSNDPLEPYKIVRIFCKSSSK